MEKTGEIPLEDSTVFSTHPPPGDQTANQRDSYQTDTLNSAKSNWTPQVYGSQNILRSSGVKLNVPRSVYGSQGLVASDSGRLSSTQVYGSEHNLARNSAYNSPYGQSPGQKTAAPPGGQQTVIDQNETVKEQEAPPIPPNYMWLSCSVLWCCFPPAGLLAFALSMASSSAAKDNRLEDAKRYSRASLVTNIVGVVLAAIAGIVLSVYIFSDIL